MTGLHHIRLIHITRKGDVHFGPFIPTNVNLTCRSYSCIPNQSLIADLGLQPHPEGGYYREIFRSESRVQPGDHRAERSALTAIYFLLVAGQHIFMLRTCWLIIFAFAGVTFGQGRVRTDVAARGSATSRLK